MDKQLTTSIVLAVLLFGFAVSLSAQNYGKPYRPFPYSYRGMAATEMSQVPTAKMSDNIGGSAAYMSATSLPQGEIYEPFTASTPSGAGPRRTPGSGGTGKTDTDNPGLLPIGDGLDILVVLALLYIVAKYVIKHTRNGTFLTKCHNLVE